MSKPSAPRRRAMGLGCLFVTIFVATAIVVLACMAWIS
jgi:hypothetical protein